MASKGKDASAAHLYAQAVLDLASAKGIDQEIAGELASIRQVVLDNRTFGLFLKDPSVSEADRRKVIVSTNVAETSLTIDGVRVVIDSGQAKIARFDPYRGIIRHFRSSQSQRQFHCRT